MPTASAKTRYAAPAAIDPTFAAEHPATVLGIMSGTSLDGVDLCAVELVRRGDGDWTHRVLAAETVAYTEERREQLERAYALPDADRAHPQWSEHPLAGIDGAYGAYLGELAADFLRERELYARTDLIASHGHTLHHRPAEGYTFQLGEPLALAQASGKSVAADFRPADVAAGGQGAPLVPLADRLLFGDYAQCLNLGGFANVSYEAEGGWRIAFDIAPAAMLLNPLAVALGQPYDAGGALARRGRVLPELLDALNALPFYAAPAPKSLGWEWYDEAVGPLFEDADGEGGDLLATATEHVAVQLGRALRAGPAGEILVTGGGAYNDFLLERTRAHLGAADRTLVLPQGELIEFKEAIAFALLGALRWRGEPNALASVTGASADVCGGVAVVPAA